MSTAENLDNKIKEFWPKSGPVAPEIEKYVKKYSKEKIVIKCGGRVLLDPNLFNNFINNYISSIPFRTSCVLDSKQHINYCAAMGNYERDKSKNRLDQ